MPQKDYPRNPSLVHFKHQAKDLLKSCHAGDLESARRIAEFHPGLAGKSRNPDSITQLQLSDAQLVIAREYGFATWEKLRTCTLNIAQFGRDAERGKKPGSLPDTFLRLICLNYTDDHISRRQEGQQLFLDHPEIRSSDIFVAAATGDLANAQRLLQGNPQLAKTKGGPLDWDPLLYATYARFSASWSRPVETVRLLLDHGADPNAGFLWDKSMCLFTALTGVFGEGEAGPTNQPRHPHEEALARLLLIAGADPNDSQVLYNRMFTKGSSHLRLLFEFGLRRAMKGPWHERLGGKVPTPAELLRQQLFWAAEHNHPDRVELLVQHGVDLNAITPAGKTAAEIAILNGYPAIADFLFAHGAMKDALSPKDAFIAACNEGSEGKARALLTRHPSLLEDIQSRQISLLISAAGDNRLDAVRLMLDLGFPVSGLGRNTALHEAAWFGHLEMVELLISRGADTSIQDREHHARPVDWALYNNQPEIVHFLEKVEGDRRH